MPLLPAALPGSGCPSLWLTVEVFSPHAEITLPWQTGLVTANRHKRRKTWNDTISNLVLSVTVTVQTNSRLSLTVTSILVSGKIIRCPLAPGSCPGKGHLEDIFMKDETRLYKGVPLCLVIKKAYLMMWCLQSTAYSDLWDKTTTAVLRIISLRLPNLLIECYAAFACYRKIDHSHYLNRYYELITFKFRHERAYISKFYLGNKYLRQFR